MKKGRSSRGRSCNRDFVRAYQLRNDIRATQDLIRKQEELKKELIREVMGKVETPI